MRPPGRTSLAVLAILAGAAWGAAAPQSTDTPPSAAVEEPRAVDEIDVNTCNTCHEKSVAGMKGTAHLGLAKNCASCHDGAADHARAMAEGTEAPTPSVKKMKAAALTGKCLTCHDRGHQSNFAGGAHDRKDVSCASCHSVHSFQSTTAQLKTARDAETCYTCHTQIRSKGMRNSHHPIREGVMNCSSCHDPHDGTKPKMVSADFTNEKCLECHTEKRGPFLWEHAPVRENCVQCHDPHGSNHEKLLVSKQPFLCQRCHLNTRHPGTLYDGVNSLAAASVSNRAVEHSCRNCHQQIHGGNAPSGPYLGR